MPDNICVPQVLQPGWQLRRDVTPLQLKATPDQAMDIRTTGCGLHSVPLAAQLTALFSYFGIVEGERGRSWTMRIGVINTVSGGKIDLSPPIMKRPTARPQRTKRHFARNGNERLTVDLLPITSNIAFTARQNLGALLERRPRIKSELRGQPRSPIHRGDWKAPSTH